MTVKIISDSGSDISQAYAAELGVRIIPLTFVLKDAEYRDGVDMTNDEFYRKMKEADELPKTSQISPYRYREVFAEETGDGSEAVCLVLSSGVSGSIWNAELAAQEFGGRVKVVDSRHFCISLRILVEYAARMAKEGFNAGQIVTGLENAMQKVRIIAVFETLENLKKGGRISSATAFAGGALGIRLMISIKNGKVEILGKTRGMRRAMVQMREYIEREGIDLSMPYAFGYTGTDPENMRTFIDRNKDLYAGNTDIEISHVGATVGTYAGDGAVAAAYFVK